MKECHSQSNFIYAGDSTSSEVIYNNMPDDTIYSRTEKCNFRDLDVNNDQISDLYFFGNFENTGYRAFKGGIYVNLQQGSWIALKDTLLNSGPKAFNFWDKIDNNCTWGNLSGSPYTLIYAYQDFIPPYTGIGGYNGNWLGKTDKYLGIRTVSGDDTIYSWIMLSSRAPGFVEILIKSFTSRKNTYTNAIAEMKSEHILSLFPNPCKDYLRIILPEITKEEILMITDINGHELFRQKIISTSTEINLSKLKTGIYFAKLFSNKEVFVRKVIKE